MEKKVVTGQDYVSGGLLLVGLFSAIISGPCGIEAMRYIGGLSICAGLILPHFRGFCQILLALGLLGLTIFLACVFPLAAGIIAGIVFLIWLISRINMIAHGAKERGELARAQRWKEFGY